LPKQQEQLRFKARIRHKDAYMTIRALIIEDQPLALRGMLTNLKKDSGIDVVAAVSGGGDPLRAARKSQPDVIIFDVTTKPRSLDPIGTIRNLKRVCPEGNILALVGTDDAVLVRGLIHAGARGCLVKTEHDVLALREKVRRLARGELIYPQEVLQRYFCPAKTALTPREAEVLRLAAKGLTSSAIADSLGISNSTVRSHLSSVYAKFGIEGNETWNPRVVAINRARQLGLL
jgi:DNA-binding NarL/FixJ family response regulator